MMLQAGNSGSRGTGTVAAIADVAHRNIVQFHGPVSGLLAALIARLRRLPMLKSTVAEAAADKLLRNYLRGLCGVKNDLKTLIYFSKLRFLDHFCLAKPASKTFLNSLLTNYRCGGSAGLVGSVVEPHAPDFPFNPGDERRTGTCEMWRA